MNNDKTNYEQSLQYQQIMSAASLDVVVYPNLAELIVAGLVLSELEFIELLPVNNYLH